ncbi:MAG: DoxX family protein [Flavobacteriales bacterium]|nr:DoxX family protein [Flavobacteriales bacterium]
MDPKVVMVVRILLGLFMITFGLIKFMGFIPFPPVEGDGGILMGIYVSSGLIKLIGELEAAEGLALLVVKFVPLALTFLIAILFNAGMFHILRDMGNIMGALIGLVLSFILVFA